MKFQDRLYAGAAYCGVKLELLLMCLRVPTPQENQTWSLEPN